MENDARDLHFTGYDARQILAAHPDRTVEVR
jgi:hypothetical protein